MTTGTETNQTETTETNEVANDTTESASLLDMDIGSDTEDETSTETESETDETETTEERLYADKYKKIEDLEKGYKELTKKLREKGPVAIEDVTHEHIQNAFTAVGEDVLPLEGYEGVYDTFIPMFKEGKFSEEQMPVIAKMFKTALGMGEINRALENGPKIDAKAELATLQAEWGNQFSSKHKAIRTWATANVPAEVLNLPLANTAAGMKFLESVMGKNSPAILDDTETGSNSALDIEARIEELMTNSDYYNNDAKGRQLQEKARVLTEKMLRMNR